MKTNEELLTDYQNVLNFLESKGELWRMKYSKELYLLELEKIRDIELNHTWFSDIHKQSSINTLLEILLQPKLTREETKTQMLRMKNAANIQFLTNAPSVQNRMRILTLPRNLATLKSIYSALYRKQITLDILPVDVQKEFKESRIGQNWLKKYG
jgi:hypothetical protein